MTGERYYLIQILCLILGHRLETAQSHLGGPESTGQFQIHFVLEGQFDASRYSGLSSTSMNADVPVVFRDVANWRSHFDAKQKRGAKQKRHKLRASCLKLGSVVSHFIHVCIAEL